MRFINMLTEDPEYGYEGLIKAAKQNFNTSLNGPSVFFPSPSSFQRLFSFFMAFNLHPDAGALVRFNLLRRCGSDERDGGSSPRKRRGGGEEKN